MNKADSSAAGLYFATYPIYQNLIYKHSVEMQLTYVEFPKKCISDLTVWSGGDIVKLGVNHFSDFDIRQSLDVNHVHGLWGMHSFVASKKSQSVPTIISPHGMMDEWALRQSPIKKRIARFIFEERLWRNSSVFHALNSNEAASIKNVVPKARVEVIPNGVEVQSYQTKPQGKIKLLFLGRIDEKKGITQLLTWYMSLKSVIKSKFEFHIAGDGNSRIVDRILQLSISEDNFFYHGSVYGEKKNDLYRSCDIFILPSFSEGLPMTVLEAWSFGLLTYISNACNLSDSYTYDFSRNVEPDDRSLNRMIYDILSMSKQEINVLAHHSVDFVSKRYSWDVISKQHNDIYREICN
ncbi:glycosyltransferase [Vibrio vulnificus]|nr:glycosyltransferase [Vibrio vulnificus]